MYSSARTDLALEQREMLGQGGEIPGVALHEEQRGGFNVTAIDILDEEGAGILCKPVGRYVTVELDTLLRRREATFAEAAELLAGEMRALLPPAGGCSLVAGLGNAAMAPDAVGPLALDSVLATRHLKRQLPEDFAAFSEVCAVRPGVLGTTGLETAELLRAVSAAVSPARILAVDALASNRLERLCRTVQLSNAGIVPGSGVGNDRAELCERTLGAPVIAIGVPTVVDAACFFRRRGRARHVRHAARYRRLRARHCKAHRLRHRPRSARRPDGRGHRHAHRLMFHVKHCARKRPCFT